MSIPNNQTISEFLHKQIDCWNNGDKEGMLEAYRSVAANSLTIEYVGGPAIDGWPALEEMWEKYNSNTKINPIDILVNGSEAGCYMRNEVTTPDGSIISPSVETYHFGEGTLHARYFHNPR